MYGLENFNCVRTNYRDNSLPRFISSDQKYLDTIYIIYIEKNKSFANTVGDRGGQSNDFIYHHFVKETVLSSGD